jgi:phosphoglycolate phosphatase
VNIRNVILDWSGTLVDDLTPVLRTTNHVLVSCGLPEISRDEFRREFCLPIRKFYERRTPNVPQARLEQLFLAKYADYQEQITLLPHTMEFLKFCTAQRMGVYIASSVDAATYFYQIERFNLAPYITKPYIGLEDKTKKIHHILDENRLLREETLFVGDMEHDIEAGKTGGIRTCAVLTGYNHPERLRAIEPDLICEHLGELQNVLAGRRVASG